YWRTVLTTTIEERFGESGLLLGRRLALFLLGWSLVRVAAREARAQGLNLDPRSNLELRVAPLDLHQPPHEAPLRHPPLAPLQRGDRAVLLLLLRPARPEEKDEHADQNQRHEHRERAAAGRRRHTAAGRRRMLLDGGSGRGRAFAPGRGRHGLKCEIHGI